MHIHDTHDTQDTHDKTKNRNLKFPLTVDFSVSCLRWMTIRDTLSRFEEERYFNVCTSRVQGMDNYLMKTAAIKMRGLAYK